MFLAISFWIYEIFSVSIVFLRNHCDMLIIEGSIIIANCVVPILLAIVNLILIKKNKPKVIQILSYVAVIILVILKLIDVISIYWNVIAVIMQLIYIHKQEKNITESNIRKITNIILYDVLQLVFTVVFLGMIVSSLVITKVNDVKSKEELFILLYGYIINLEGATNEKLLIPVEKDNQYDL